MSESVTYGCVGGLAGQPADSTRRRRRGSLFRASGVLCVVYVFRLFQTFVRWSATRVNLVVRQRSLRHRTLVGRRKKIILGAR